MSETPTTRPPARGRLLGAATLTGLVAGLCTPASYPTGDRVLVGGFVVASVLTAIAVHRYLTPRVGTFTSWVGFTVLWTLAAPLLALAARSCESGDGCTPTTLATWMTLGATWALLHVAAAAGIAVVRTGIRAAVRTVTTTARFAWHGTRASAPRADHRPVTDPKEMKPR